jgi:hypothetical protein
VGAGAGVAGAGADGVGVAAGVGALEGAGAAFFFAFGGFFLAGSEPDGEYATSAGAGATWIGLTADGAAVLLLLPLALPMPNAAPKATSAATTPMATSFPGVIRTSSLGCWSLGWCT